MTERMQNYRLKKEAEGMVQVRVWVPKDHEEFIKYIAKQCHPDKPLKSKERYGRRATNKHIQLADTLARIQGKEPPKHLYDYHISLSAWMWANGGKSMGDMN